MKIALNSLFLLSISLVLTGCHGLHRQQPIPSSVTIDEAMKQIGQGFRAMREELDGKAGQEKIRTGLVPTETVVTFKLTQSESDSSKLALDLSNPVIVDTNNKGGSISAEIGSASASEVGNTISIKLVSSLDYLAQKTVKSCTTSKDENDKDLTNCDVVTTNAIDKNAVEAYQAWLSIGHQMFRMAPGDGSSTDISHPFITVPQHHFLEFMDEDDLILLQSNLQQKLEGANKSIQ